MKIINKLFIYEFPTHQLDAHGQLKRFIDETIYM